MGAYDVAVVGGGIVGLATARELATTHGLAPLVLERETDLAAHQTGHNSGVLHSGLYYRPDSHKARACVEGSRSLSDYVALRGLPALRCGKLVVATGEEELGRLAELERRGRANGISGLERVDRTGLLEHEPEVSGLAGLWVPTTAVVDFVAVARSFAADVEAAGGAVRRLAPVTAIRLRGGAVEIRAGDERVSVPYLVACAGLEADRIARLAGLRPAVRIVPFRGDYFEIGAGAGRHVRGLVYPVPDPELPFLGVHVHRRLDGRVEAGPNAVLAWRRAGYRPGEVSARDAAATLAFGGFWRMARRQAAIARREYRRAWSRRRFGEAVRRLVPSIRDGEIAYARSGVRAQAVDAEGRLVDDFVFAEGERMMHVLNAPSPAATASMAIARTLAERVMAALGERRSAAEGRG